MTRLSRLISLGLGSVLTLLGVNSATLYTNLGQLDTDRQHLSQSQATLQTLQQTFSRLKDAETGQRGYLLTGKARYLEPYRAAIAALNRRGTGGQQTQDTPQQQTRMQQLEPAIAQKLAELQATITLRQTQGLEAEKAALRLVQTDRGQQLMDRIRQQMATMEAEQNRLIAARSQELTNRTNQMGLTFLSINGSAALLLALTFYRIWRDRGDRPLQAESPQAAHPVPQRSCPQIPVACQAAGNSAQVEPPSLAALPMEAIDLLPLIEASLRQLTAPLQARDAEVKVAHPLPPVLTRPPILLQTLTHLIDQALKSVPLDRHPQLKIYAEDAQNSMCLWIETNGCGLIEEISTFCYLDGQVGVESQWGQGSRFWIALPTPIEVEPSEPGFGCAAF